MLDLGGESTRPGAEPVSEAEEIARVVPVITALRASVEVPISIDTMKPGVARAAVKAGATIWNDVTALRGAPESMAVAAELDCGVILMHMRGEPRTMQSDPRYGEVVREVRAFLRNQARAAVKAGVRRERIWIDPGIGFGKTLAHNLALLKRLDSIMTGSGFPVVLGLSRKSFIKTIDPRDPDADARLGGSLAGALWGAMKGVHVLRVHDVRENSVAVWVCSLFRSSPKRDPGF